MRIAVTGAAGFMGSWLADELAARGHEVVGIDNASGSFNYSFDEEFGKFEKPPEKWRLELADCRYLPKMLELTKGCDAIFHLAAYAAEGQSVFSPIAINDINIRGMNTMLVAAANNGVKKFVFTSSMAVYGDRQPPFDECMIPDPCDPYGAGKAYCEQMLRIFGMLHGVEWCILRPHNVYGPRQNIADPYRNVLGIWMNRIMRGKPPLIYGSGEQMRAFSYIDDVTAAIARTLDDWELCSSRIINVGGATPCTINAACDAVLEAAGSDLKPLHVPGRPGETKDAWCSTGLSESLLDYKDTVTLEDGIRRMWEWAKGVGPMKPTYALPLEIEKGAPEVWLKRKM